HTAPEVTKMQSEACWQDRSYVERSMFTQLTTPPDEPPLDAPLDEVPPEDPDDEPPDEVPPEELPPEEPPGDPLPVVFPPQARSRQPAKAGMARALTRRWFMTRRREARRVPPRETRKQGRPRRCATRVARRGGRSDQGPAPLTSARVSACRAIRPS